jgi:tetratricopeptide (TPR) repeat protein
LNLCPPQQTSGTAGGNRNIAQAIRSETSIRAKTAGTGAYHNWRARRQYIRAVVAYRGGELARSRDLFEALLRDYPEDPHALEGLARIDLDQGLLDNAEAFVRRALEIHPSSANYRLTRAVILELLGRREDAAQDALFAARDATLRPRAEEVLRRLGTLDVSNLPKPVAARPESNAASPLGLCPCGSGSRFSECCGANAEDPAPARAHRTLQEASACFVRGDAQRGKALIDTLVPADVASPELARAAGKICLELLSLEQAFGFLDRSSKLMPSAEADRLLRACCDLIFRDRTRDSAHAMVRRLRERIEKRSAAARSPSRRTIHILGTLGTIGGSENRAVRLYRMLSPHADVRLWSISTPLERQYPGLPIHVLAPERGAFPEGGTLVLAGHYFDSGDWWSKAKVDRVVICVNLDFPARLVHRLADIEQTQTVARIDFTFCSKLSKDLFGLPGEIEYPLADVTRFSRAAPRHAEGIHLRIGRHSRDQPIKHHPNDPALYRRLVARGHELRLLGATCLQAAFAGDPAAQAIELLPTGAEDPRNFLEGLDCFIYRKHPHFLETGGTSILEAMAMALPVIVFRDGVGVAELIDDGRDGFLVDTEEEAYVCVDRLAEDGELRMRVGSAARDKVVDVMRDQERRILAYYLGST